MADPTLAHSRTRQIARATVALTAAALLLQGCGILPRGDGLRAAPAGFVRMAQGGPARGPFPGRDVLRQERYLRARPPGGSSAIVVTEYRGPIGEREVLAAHDVIVRRERLESFGPLEPLTIDGHAAWSWFMVRARGPGPARTECVAVVSGDTSAFAIQLSTAEARLQDPALQQRIVASFIVPEREPAPGPEFFGFGAVAAMACALLLIMTLPRTRD